MSDHEVWIWEFKQCHIDWKRVLLGIIVQVGQWQINRPHMIQSLHHGLRHPCFSFNSCFLACNFQTSHSTSSELWVYILFFVLSLLNIIKGASSVIYNKLLSTEHCLLLERWVSEGHTHGDWLPGGARPMVYCVGLSAPPISSARKFVNQASIMKPPQVWKGCIGYFSYCGHWTPDKKLLKDGKALFWLREYRPSIMEGKVWWWGWPSAIAEKLWQLVAMRHNLDIRERMQSTALTGKTLQNFTAPNLPFSESSRSCLAISLFIWLVNCPLIYPL